MTSKNKIALFLTLIVLSAQNAYAYIDPNTGGFFFQTVAPFVYGILGVIVVFWKRIINFVKGLFSKKKNGDSSTGNE
ncbi:MAG: hypothetical protein HZC48_06505 [Nitrospirae bacterium]|nr:hypothetical protein [Nitrospirota bacterium]